MAITILDAAEMMTHKFEESLSGEDFYNIGLPFFAGCEICHASLAAYNAYPTKTGYIRCKDCCNENLVFETLQEFLESRNFFCP